MYYAKYGVESNLIIMGLVCGTPGVGYSVPYLWRFYGKFCFPTAIRGRCSESEKRPAVTGGSTSRNEEARDSPVVPQTTSVKTKFGKGFGGPMEVADSQSVNYRRRHTWVCGS